jgi:DNA helicase HerA-like ATPase
MPADAKSFSNPLVFFVNDSQQGVIEKALSSAEGARSEKTNATPRSTRAARRAASLADIAGEFLNHCKINSRT